MISSTQSVWLQERQRYLYHSLGPVHGPSLGSCRFWEGFVMGHLREEPELLEDTVSGRIDQFPLHGIATLRAGQRVLAKGFLEPLCKRRSGKHSEATGIGRGCAGLPESGQSVSVPGITGVGVQPVIPDSLESFGQDMLDHASEEGQDRYGLRLDGLGLVVSIPVADRLVIIAFDASDGDRRGGDLLGEILGESFPPGGHLSFLQESDEALGVVFPALVDLGLDGGRVHLFREHGQQMVLPFAVHEFVGDIGDGFPSALGIDSPGREQDVKMGVVSTGSATGLQDDNGPEGE